MAGRTSRYIVSVLARDRVGIIADVSDALFRLDGNLESISQTISQGWFTMILSAAFPEAVGIDAVREAVASIGDVVAMVRPSAEERIAVSVEGEPFVATAVGQDKPGIVRGLTRCLARRSVNIQDVWNEVREKRFIVIFHLTVPPRTDPNELRGDLKDAAKELDVDLTFQHQDIFTAINSLSAHTRRF
jgi:glycine cleavage system transcriptional repressor